MIVIVDSNILFSACLSPQGRIFEILFNKTPSIEFISCHLAVDELERHLPKMLRLSKLPEVDLLKQREIIFRRIDFIDEEIIVEKHWIEAERLTRDVDANDINFVALALQTGGMLWTGDKKLSDHLKSMDFKRVTNTAELYDLLKIG